MFFTHLFESNLRLKNYSPKVIYYTSTNSTNEDVWNLFLEEKEDNIIVITDYQKNGKGRQNNIWFSKPGHSITCSFLLKEVFSKKQFNFHAILIPVAIVNAIKLFLSIDVTIKWPNDIMYNNQKLCGVLIESKNIGKNIFNIGFGINVNETTDDFPKELQSHAISLKQILGHPIQREPLLAYIFNELNLLINKLDITSLTKQWMHSCYHKNSEVSFKYNNKSVKGIFKYINDKGQAVINLNNKYIQYDGAINIL